MCGHKGVKCPPGMKCQKVQTAREYLNDQHSVRRSVRHAHIRQAHRQIRRSTSEFIFWTWQLIKALVGR